MPPIPAAPWVAPAVMPAMVLPRWLSNHSYPVAIDDVVYALVRALSLRPGDVVRVDLDGREIPEGFYVPEDAIQSDARQTYVAVAGESSGDTQQVEFVPVNAQETVGRLQRIDLSPDRIPPSRSATGHGSTHGRSSGRAQMGGWPQLGSPGTNRAIGVLSHRPE